MFFTKTHLSQIKLKTFKNKNLINIIVVFRTHFTRMRLVWTCLTR